MTDQKHPIDFLGNEIKIGSIVCYPTGGQSCRMVLAKVVHIKDDAKVWDGHRGQSPYRIQVQRIQEGTRTANGDGRWGWSLDTKRKVSIDQIHRMIVLTSQQLVNRGDVIYCPSCEEPMFTRDDYICEACRENSPQALDSEKESC